MEGEEPAADVLTLFDFYWFHHLILGEHRPPPPPPPLLTPPPPLHQDLEDAESQASEPPPISRGSSRDEFAPSPEARLIRPPKLQTIFSGKEGTVGNEIPRAEVTSGSDGEMRKAGRRSARGRRPRRRRGGGSRSLSDLEFEELKGFMDLGFTFSDAEADPRLMSIVPGLQRLRAAAGDGESEAEADASPSLSDCAAADPAVSRPYLSEAWDAAAAAAVEEEENNLLRRWRIPAAKDGVDLKEHLRLWAHTVASTVR